MSCGISDPKIPSIQVPEINDGGRRGSRRATAEDYQREAAEKESEYDSTASALEGKRELTEDETARLTQPWKKLVRMFHPDIHKHDPEKRKTYERLTQAIYEARDRGDIELLELIAKDPQAFILKQGGASVSFDGERDLKVRCSNPLPATHESR